MCSDSCAVAPRESGNWRVESAGRLRNHCRVGDRRDAAYDAAVSRRRVKPRAESSLRDRAGTQKEPWIRPSNVFSSSTVRRVQVSRTVSCSGCSWRGTGSSPGGCGCSARLIVLASGRPARSRVHTLMYRGSGPAARHPGSGRLGAPPPASAAGRERACRALVSKQPPLEYWSSDSLFPDPPNDSL